MRARNIPNADGFPEDRIKFCSPPVIRSASDPLIEKLVLTSYMNLMQCRDETVRLNATTKLGELAGLFKQSKQANPITMNAVITDPSRFREIMSGLKSLNQPTPNEETE